MRIRILVILVLGAATLAVSWFTGGCGPSSTISGSTSSEQVSSVKTPSTAAAATGTAANTSSPSVHQEPTATQSEIAVLFAELAHKLAPLPVYGLAELPPEASIAAEWWPATSVESPSVYEGPRETNPWVSDSPPGTQEAQVLLEKGEGWLVVIENFRGDLGDVLGVPAGNVAGQPATLYELSGGFLVQWSDQGAWYGVFGRGVASEEVLRTALSLTVVGPGD